MVIDMGQQATQTALADLVGVTQPTISILISEGKLPPSGTLGELLLAYCQRLRAQAAGRIGEGLGLDLVQERAALAREQRIGYEMKNAINRGDYAPVGLLADVLGTAASAIVDRLDHLEGALAKTCPDLPQEARDTIFSVLADARNEWVRSTAKLVDAAVGEMLAESGDADEMEGSNDGQ